MNHSTFLVVALAACLALPPSAAAAEKRYSYSMEYQVRISESERDVARVRWKFAGIDEVEYARLDLAEGRFFDFSGTGHLEQKGDELLWQPGKPYAHLEYKVRLRQRRSSDKGYDSYATKDWVITRAKTLFPPVRLSVNRDIEPDPLPRCEVVFRLPAGWEAHTMMEPTGPRSFRPPASGRFLDLPKGWIALGKLDVVRRKVHDTALTVAKAPESGLDTKGIASLYAKALPLLGDLLDSRPARLLVVSGPDPMWRGGISGRWSYYLHGDRPLRTPDKTSPPLHELFHVLAPFRPAEDGAWITEGLAEYYSLALQHRFGKLKDRDFRRGLRLFERYGEWNVNLTARRNISATNNSAPLIVHAIDQAIRERTKGERSLDDVVRELTKLDEKVSTAGFLRAVNEVSGHNFTPFFQRHVYAGIPPKIAILEEGAGKDEKHSRTVP